MTALPSPPGSAQMTVKPDADQPSPMCPGKKAVYECSTSGINVRLVRSPKKRNIWTANLILLIMTGSPSQEDI